MTNALTSIRVADQLVVIGGSAGAIGPLCAILAQLSPSLPAAVVVVQEAGLTPVVWLWLGLNLLLALPVMFDWRDARRLHA